MPNRVYFYLNKGVHLLDLAGAVQAFHSTSEYGETYDIHFISDTKDQTASVSIEFTHLEIYSEAQILPTDILIVAGFTVKNLPMDNDNLFNWLRFIHAQGTTVCSICTGCFLLAEAGLLDNHYCTTHWDYTKRLQKQYPKTKVLENRLYVQSGNIYTSAGVSTGIDLALYLLEKRHGAAFAFKIARELVVYIRRDGSDAQDSIYLQHRQHINNRIQDLQDWIIQHLDKKLTLEELAQHIHTSPRNLTRLFKATTGITIGKYIEKLRVEKALQLLRENHKVEVVAQSCGFQSENQLRTILKKNLGGLPSKMSEY